MFWYSNEFILHIEIDIDISDIVVINFKIFTAYECHNTFISVSNIYFPKALSKGFLSAIFLRFLLAIS